MGSYSPLSRWSALPLWEPGMSRSLYRFFAGLGASTRARINALPWSWDCESRQLLQSPVSHSRRMGWQPAWSIDTPGFTWLHRDNGVTVFRPGCLTAGLSIWAGCRSNGVCNACPGAVSGQWRDEARGGWLGHISANLYLIVRNWTIAIDQAERRLAAEKAVNPAPLSSSVASAIL